MIPPCQINQRAAKTKASKDSKGVSAAAVPIEAILAPSEAAKAGINPYLLSAPEADASKGQRQDRSKAFSFSERGVYERRAAEMRAKVWTASHVFAQCGE